MKIETFEENVTYIINPPDHWFELEKPIQRRYKFLLDTNIFDKEPNKENCFAEIKFHSKGISLKASQNMIKLLAHRKMVDMFNEIFKAKTKPKGRNPVIVKRNKQIQKEYYELHNKKGFKSSKVHNLLAEKYNLSVETIKSYVK